MSAQISLRDEVQFEDAGTHQLGTVVGIKRDIGNGQGFVVVELADQLPGSVQAVPLENVRRVAK